MNTFHDFTLQKINGEPLPLVDFKDHVVLLVNVASECGYTKQYTGLQEIYDMYKNKGFVVLGVPCNQFGGQEPGTEAEIENFCTTKFNVTFPLTSKIEVKGKQQHPLYAWLTNDEARYPGDIGWNFAKFLIGKNGEVLKRFDSGDKPNSEEVITAIETALA
jgi:glutathione peroxidase